MSEAMSPQAERSGSGAELTGARLRWAIYFLLIAIGAGGICGRILALNSVDQIMLEQRMQRDGKDVQLQRPFLSANDRSRWCTIRALVELGTYEIDEIVRQPGWETIDMVKHDGHLYSSKPPLLTTLLAGEYWVIHQLTGATLGTEPHAIGRFMLLTVNLLPLILYWVLLGHLAERYGRTDWGKLLVLATGIFGTFLTTFAITLNNHLIAAVCVMVTLVLFLRIWHDGSRSLGVFLLAGVAAAFAAANELPALSFLCLLGAVLLWRFPRQMLLGFTPGVLLIAAGFFGTNYAAHGILLPPYTQRAEDGENWYEYEYERNGRLVQSYWQNRQGIDLGEQSRAIYAVNSTVGHHGVFSLTPIWVLSLLGLGIILLGRQQRSDLFSRAAPMSQEADSASGEPDSLRKSIGREVAGGILLLSAVCLAFYLSRPLIDRNYGGITSGFRWMFWFAPLWLLAMLPAADLVAKWRWTRGLALVLLAASVMSVSYPTWNPWVHPWAWNFARWMGWM